MVKRGQSSTKSSTMCLKISRNLGMFLGIFLGIPVEPITPLREAGEMEATRFLNGFRIGATRVRLVQFKPKKHAKPRSLFFE